MRQRTTQLFYQGVHSMGRDYYAILGVAKGADENELKRGEGSRGAAWVFKGRGCTSHACMQAVQARAALLIHACKPCKHAHAQASPLAQSAAAVHYAPMHVHTQAQSMHARTRTCGSV